MHVPPASDAGLLSALPPLRLAGHGIASDYAHALLESLGARVTTVAGPEDLSAAIAWAQSGLMSLTGLADGPAQMCPAPLASCADGAVRALSCLAPLDAVGSLPAGRALLGERAAIARLHRKGLMSPGGSCRLLAGADGWFAVNLPRAADWADVPAWLESGRIESWDALASTVAARAVEPLVERARLLGLAACVSAPPAAVPRPWFSAARHGPAAPIETRVRPPRIVDLSSLWAGPLCSHLLQQLGGEVIKVESPDRPDGARRGPADFFDLLNHRKRSVAIPFDGRGMERLHALLDWADIVIEGSRPRALRERGIVAEQCVARRPGLTWVSLTGYGRDEPGSDWVAFGDDGAVAAGLSSLMQQLTGAPLVCGDALADPLAGMHAALAGLASHRGGGGHLIEITLRDVVAHGIAFGQPRTEAAMRERWRAWTAEARALGLDAVRPAARAVTGRACPLGADNDSVFRRPSRAC
ncbi:MAG: CoA transferase [Steroidobacteraceae bacterium]